jgi:hypothetical protein
MIDVPHAPAGVDSSKPAPARIYDYMLQGDHHFESDIQAAQRLLSAVPEIRDCAWSNRGFHQRAAKWIAERGVRQFLDIGSGLPTVGNTHEVVQKVHPDARVVYALTCVSQPRCWPIVSSMSLLTSVSPPGCC